MIQIHIKCTNGVFDTAFRTTVLQQQQESAIDIALPFITFYVTFQKIVSIRNSDCNFTLLRLLIVLWQWLLCKYLDKGTKQNTFWKGVIIKESGRTRP